MTNVTADTCHSLFLQNVLFPYMSGAMFGLLSVVAFSAAVLVIVRRVKKGYLSFVHLLN